MVLLRVWRSVQSVLPATFALLEQILRLPATLDSMQTPPLPLVSLALLAILALSAATANPDPCTPGTYSVLRWARLRCSACPLGSYAPLENVTSPATECPAGFSCPNGASNATACPPGSYSTSWGCQVLQSLWCGFLHSNARVDLLLPAVRLAITAQPGTINPILCQSGAYAHRLRPIAPPVPPVSFVLRLAQPAPLPCAPGNFSSSSDSTICQECLPGSYASVKQTPQLARPVPLAQLVQTLDKSIQIHLPSRPALLLPRR
jgi:hypothetical protein